MEPIFATLGGPYILVGVNIAMRAGYWRFTEAPGGADKAQR